MSIVFVILMSADLKRKGFNQDIKIVVLSLLFFFQCINVKCKEHQKIICATKF